MFFIGSGPGPLVNYQIRLSSEKLLSKMVKAILNEVD